MSQELPLASSSHHLDESADGGDGGGRLDHSHLGLGASGHASGSGSHLGLGSDQLPEIEGSALGDGAAHGKKRGRPPGTKVRVCLFSSLSISSEYKADLTRTFLAHL